MLDVRHISLNRFEVVFASGRPAGTVHGYDASGIVACGAADGSGPAVGTRVAAFGGGPGRSGWLWTTSAVAEVPDDVDLADAAAIPMAGITALRALRSRDILGRRVLITGAAGGVGPLRIAAGGIGGVPT